MSVAALTREPGRAYLLRYIRNPRHREAAAAPQVGAWPGVPSLEAAA